MHELNKSHLSEDLLFNLCKLDPVTVSPLKKNELNKINQYIAYSFCFENALLAMKILDADSVVYGGVRVKQDTGKWLSAEHVWIRIGDNYYDPTYQKLVKEHSDCLYSFEYYKLFEIGNNEYSQVAKSLGHAFGDMIGMDFSWFRNSPTYSKYFS